MDDMSALRTESRLLQQGFREQQGQQRDFLYDMQEDFNELKWNLAGGKTQGELI